MSGPTDKENVTASIPSTLARQLDELVKKSGISRSQYIGHLVKEAVEKKRVFAMKTTVEIVEI